MFNTVLIVRMIAPGAHVQRVSIVGSVCLLPLV